MANGQAVGSADYGDKIYNGCSFGAGTAVLERGDEVWIQCFYGSKQMQSPLQWNYFSGTLIGM